MAFQNDHPVYQAIRLNYETANLGPETPLKIDALAHQHSSSAIPVREALIRLASEDVAQLIPGQGFRIRSISHDEMLSHYRICKFLFDMTLSDLEHLQNMSLSSCVAISWSELEPADRTADTEPAYQERRLSALGALVLNSTQNKVYQRSLLITRPVRWIMHDDPDMAPNISEYLKTVLPHLENRQFCEARLVVLNYFDKMQTALRTPYEMYCRQFV